MEHTSSLATGTLLSQLSMYGRRPTTTTDATEKKTKFTLRPRGELTGVLSLHNRRGKTHAQLAVADVRVVSITFTPLSLL